MKTKKRKKWLEDFYLVIILLFLYAPMTPMMVLSFRMGVS